MESFSSLRANFRGSMRSFIINTVTVIVTVAIGLFLGELLLRFKNSNQKNYNIEMWRYARVLKNPSENPDLGHEHIPDKSAKLQGYEIKLNSWGMRGPEPDLKDTSRKRILFLGSSNTLGWGVEESETLTGILQSKIGDKAQIFNAGIGNYNTHRYVTLFENKLRSLKPDIVVIHYFINDAEVLKAGGGNPLLRNSQFAVTLYHLIQSRKFAAAADTNMLEDHYKKIYSDNGEGRGIMEAALARLKKASREDGFKIIFSIVPDIHSLDPYPFTFVHTYLQEVAQKHGWTFIDFTEPLKKVPTEDLWAMPGDPHINKVGHKIMAETLVSFLL